MNPAPPVTRMFICLGGGKWQTRGQIGEVTNVDLPGFSDFFSLGGLWGWVGEAIGGA